MITSTPPEGRAVPAAAGAPCLDALPLPAPGEERVFQAPWEARAFALVVALHRRGVFPWPAFADALAAAIRRGGPPPDPASGSTSPYYGQWLAAAESLLAARGVLDEATLSARAEAIAHELAHQHDHR